MRGSVLPKDRAAGGWGVVLGGFGVEVCTSQVPALSLLPISNTLVTAAMGMAAWDEPQLEDTVLGGGSWPQAALWALGKLWINLD